MALTLTIVDNADGTGATATVAGSQAAADNCIFVQPLTNLLPAGDPLDATQLAGDGSVLLDLDAGHYLAWCLSIDGGTLTVSQAVPFVATDGTQSVYRRILLAVQAKIRLLALSGIAQENVTVRSIATEQGVTYPAAIIVPQRPVTNPRGGVLGADDVQYGVIVVLLAADNHAADNTATYTDWLERISRAFRNQRLAGVSEVHSCEVSPGDAIDRQGWDNQRFVGLQILKFISREPRGV